MASIRPLERSDLPAVATLYELVARSGSRTPAPGLERYFEKTFFDHPWADPEIPSLVFVDDDGVIGGFLGSSVRRFTFRDRPIRVGVSGQLVTDPAVRNRAAGLFLMKEYLEGAQDLTVTDTASDLVRRLWERLGGETFQLACVGWVRIFQPLGFAAEYAARRERSAVSKALRAVGAPVDFAVRRARRRSGPSPTVAPTEPLTPSSLVDYLPVMRPGFEVRPAYDEAFVEWLFRELSAVPGHGELVARLVRDQAGDPLGWFVYYAPPGGIGSVLQVLAREEDDVDTVLEALFADASGRGTTGLQGRVEGPLRRALAATGCLFHPSGYLALVHSQDSSLLHEIQAGRALLTRLEGEWWMGHHLVEAEDLAR